MILGMMENEGEKIIFLVVWMNVEKRRDFGGVHKFSLLPIQNTISPNWRENGSEKWTKIFGQNCPHFLFTFFFWLPQPDCKCGLSTIFFPFFFFFCFLNMMMCKSVIHHSTIHALFFFLGRFLFLIF